MRRLAASGVGDALGAGYEFDRAPYDGWPAMIGGGLGNLLPASGPTTPPKR
ncbi:MAG: hypothetical protein R2709_14225 [Marmoricola sp.]